MKKKELSSYMSKLVDKDLHGTMVLFFREHTV